jgi:hypothetical protein
MAFYLLMAESRSLIIESENLSWQILDLPCMEWVMEEDTESLSFCVNGPELALAILAVSNWASCVPLNANGATIELQKDLQMSGASMVIGMVDTSATIQDMAKALHIPFCGLKLSKTEAGIFDLVPMSPNVMYAPTGPRRNGRIQPDNDICCNPKAFDDAASVFSSSSADNETNFLSNERTRRRSYRARYIWNYRDEEAGSP